MSGDGDTSSVSVVTLLFSTLKAYEEKKARNAAPDSDGEQKDAASGSVDAQGANASPADQHDRPSRETKKAPVNEENGSERDNDELIVQIQGLPPLKPFRVVPELLKWHLASSGPVAGCWTRLLWANELYQERRSAMTFRSDDMITVTKVDIPSTMDPEHFVELLRIAMIKLRFEHPLTAATIVSGTVEPAVHPAFVYRVPESCEELEAWRDNVLFVSRAEDETPLDVRVENFRRGLINDELDLTTSTRRLHLVLSGHPEEKHSVAFVSHCAHAATDTQAEMVIVRTLLETVADIDAGNTVNFSELPWGEEVQRLPCVLQELVGNAVDDCDWESALNSAKRTLAGYSLRLDPIKVHGNGRSPTERGHVVLTEDQTKALLAASRARGVTLTQAVDAARHMAYMEMRRMYIEDPRIPKYESLHTNFLMPFNVRKRITGKWASRPVVCNTTAGFTTVLPLMDPYFERADSEFARHDVPISETSQVQTLCSTAEKLKEQYLAAQDNFDKIIKAQPVLIHICGVLEDFYPPSDPSPEGFSSVGILENTLPREIPIATHTEPFRTTDWYVSLSMSRHIASLSFSMHIWTHHDKLHLSVFYTHPFNHDFVMRFLDSMRISLLLFARSFGSSN